MLRKDLCELAMVSTFAFLDRSSHLNKITGGLKYGHAGKAHLNINKNRTQLRRLNKKVCMEMILFDSGAIADFLFFAGKVRGNMVEKDAKFVDVNTIMLLA